MVEPDAWLRLVEVGLVVVVVVVDLAAVLDEDVDSAAVPDEDVDSAAVADEDVAVDLAAVVVGVEGVARDSGALFCRCLSLRPRPCPPRSQPALTRRRPKSGTDNDIGR